MSEVNGENARNEAAEPGESEEVIPEGKVCSVEETDRVIFRWAEAMGLSSKLDESGLFPEEVSGLRKTMRELRDPILDGKLVLDESSRFVFELYPVSESDKKIGSLTFDEPDMSMLRKARAERNPVTAEVILISGMTKRDPILLGKMKQRNAAVCGAIVKLFLG